jgi:hypothetical protein
LFPLFARLAKSAVWPVTVKLAVRKQAFTVPLPAPRYWQSRHQHTRVTIGGSELCHRTAPHRHLPLTTMRCSRAKTYLSTLKDATPSPVGHHARQRSPCVFNKFSGTARGMPPSPSLVLPQSPMLTFSQRQTLSERKYPTSTRQDVELAKSTNQQHWRRREAVIAPAKAAAAARFPTPLVMQRPEA